jgi:hypothetical protein
MARAGVAGAAAVWVAAVVAVPLAQQARPMVPMAASSIARFPDTYIGENVSVAATVEALLSKTTFTIDQDATRTTGQEILVIAPSLNTVPAANALVTVQGEVFKFDLGEVAKRAKGYVLDLPPEAIARFQGKPAIFATAVIDSKALVDLAKRIPPPMTPAEIALDKAMKTISPTFNDLRGGLETPNADEIKKQTAALKTAFGEAESFFKTRNTADATGWAQEALKFVAAIEAGAAAARWDEVKTAATGLGGLCQQCHTAHRERQDDGSFRVRMGGQ